MLDEISDVIEERRHCSTLGRLTQKDQVLRITEHSRMLTVLRQPDMLSGKLLCLSVHAGLAVCLFPSDTRLPLQ
ncbi:hypothetical protein KIN20_014248 [Parelaphostrongylus tenuis]|uniref:Uncharacterized protein n=1 Tax=Parelaphostrongylus tenuis TaxID=148309 RepID=A0AAD5QN77_PARTN|nr:hypothetical protein KIN20_014248 [Parelaphostrongylus tenuis]